MPFLEDSLRGHALELWLGAQSYTAGLGLPPPVGWGLSPTVAWNEGCTSRLSARTRIFAGPHRALGDSFYATNVFHLPNPSSLLNLPISPPVFHTRRLPSRHLRHFPLAMTKLCVR